MKSYNILFIFLMMSVTAGQADAGIYKGTDKDGYIHFGDRPADIDTVTELHLKAINSAGIKNSSGNNKEREYLLNKIGEDDKAGIEERRMQAANDKKRRSLCNSYCIELQSYSQFGRILTVAPMVSVAVLRISSVQQTRINLKKASPSNVDDLDLIIQKRAVL